MIKSYDESVETKHNLNWLYIADLPYRILIIGGSGLGKINVLQNLIKHQRLYCDKFFLYVKDPFETKYSIAYQQRKNRDYKIKKFKGIH